MKAVIKTRTKTWVLMMLWMLVLPTSAAALELRIEDKAYLCVQDNFNPNWPEFFAVQVEVVAVLEKRLKVRVINHYPRSDRVNEEATLVTGDKLKISKSRVYTADQAGVKRGLRFDGKPVCSKLMALESRLGRCDRETRAT